MSAENRVTFDRIGRHGGRTGSPAPAPIVRALSGDQLADSIALYARRFLASPSFEVVLNMETGRGSIFAGFRNAGSFTVEAITAEAGDAYEELEAVLRNSDVGYLDHRYGADAEPAAIAATILAKHRAEAVAEVEAYPGELAMLRGVLRVVRSIARHGDLVDTEGVRELRRIITEHYADERAAYAAQGEKATPTGTTATPQPEPVIYRASHESIILGHYTSPNAAWKHCEAYAEREFPAPFAAYWSDDDGATELTISVHGSADIATGYLVTPLTVASAYDEEADE